MVALKANAVIESLGLPYFRQLSTLGALSDKAIIDLLSDGCITQYEKGEMLFQWGTEVTGFRVVLQGNLAFYKHCEGHDVLTRHCRSGEQISFDTMIGLKPHSGNAIAVEKSLVLKISFGQFYDFHVNNSTDFGLLMINLSRELSREIEVLEDVIGKSTSWS